MWSGSPSKRPKRIGVAIGFALWFLGLSLVAWTPPEGRLYLAEEDLDAWHEEGLLRTDEWEQLRNWLETPLDLSRATREELLLLPGLDEAVADRLLDARRRTRLDFATLSGLRIPPDALFGLLPFVLLGGKGEFAPRGHLRQTATDTLADDTPPYVRGFLRLQPGPPVTIGLAEVGGGRARPYWDADAGTVRPVAPSRLARGYLDWRRKGRLRRVILGDFGVGFGSGLLLNTAQRRYPRGVVPNDSSIARERGLAGEWTFGGIEGVLFASKNTRRAALPVGVASGSRSVDGAFEETLVGGRIETAAPKWRLGGTILLARRKNRTPYPLGEAERVPHLMGGIDGEVAFGPVRWRSELADVETAGLWTELVARGGRGSGTVAFFLLPMAFESPFGSRRGDRRGLFARGRLRLIGGSRLGGQLEMVRQLSTWTASLRGRLWIMIPIHRRISAGVSHTWRDPNRLRRFDMSRRTSEWVGYGGHRVAATVRLVQRRRAGTARDDQGAFRVRWFDRRGWVLGAAFDLGGRPSWGNGIAPRAFSIRIGRWVGRRSRFRLTLSRRWRDANVTNSVRLSLDYRWGSAR